MTPEHVGTWLVTVTDDGHKWASTAVEVGGHRAAMSMSTQSAYAAAADALGSAMPEPDEVSDEAMSCPVCGEPAGICECPVCPWGNRDCPNPGAPQGAAAHAECMPRSELQQQVAEAMARARGNADPEVCAGTGNHDGQSVEGCDECVPDFPQTFEAKHAQQVADMDDHAA